LLPERGTYGKVGGRYATGHSHIAMVAILVAIVGLSESLVVIFFNTFTF